MKLPEWRPIPPHMKGRDEDSRDFLSALRLIVPIVVIAFSVLLLIVGLLT